MSPSSPRPAAARAFAVATMCASALVAGLSVSDANAQSLYPVVITATRSETTIDRALADVSVIDAQAVRDAGASTLPELLRSAGGIEISQTGGAGSLSGLFVRGTRNSQTVILVDGVRMENPLSGGGLIENLPLSSIDRIEIVRGPASSIYGSGAIGGVVQIFTRQPGADGLHPFASAAAGSRGTAQVQAGFRAAREGTRVALGLSHDRTSGFEATRPGSSDFQRDRDGNRQSSLTASLAHRLTPRWELGAALLLTDGRMEYDDAFSTPDSARKDYRSSALSAFARGRLLAGWHTELRVGNSSLDYGFAGFSFAPRTDSRTVAWQNTVEAWGGSLLFGIESLSQRIDGEGVTRGGGASYVRERRDTDSVFGGYERGWGDHTLRATLRRDRIESVGSETTGAIAWGWQLDPLWLVRASYGTAFRAPTFDDLYNPFSPNPTLQPEKSRGFEVAAERRSAAGLFRAIAFSSRIDDAIELDSTFTARNLARARVHGLTLEARRAIGAWTLRGSATVQHTEGVLEDPLANLRTEGELTRRAPRFGVLGVERQQGRWRYGAEAVAQARRFDTQGQRMGGYAFVDAWAAYRLDRDWELFGRAGNLGDRDYETVSGYRSLPRSLLVGVRYAMR
ncbi:MAG: TonB-dependent receptor [Burkholderiaceae bacterium]|nr:TonB-dependent receptor [Burkholderiaceae bacterium]